MKNRINPIYICKHVYKIAINISDASEEEIQDVFSASSLQIQEYIKTKLLEDMNFDNYRKNDEGWAITFIEKPPYCITKLHILTQEERKKYFNYKNFKCEWIGYSAWRNPK
jgi:hypothetical protein